MNIIHADRRNLEELVALHKLLRPNELKGIEPFIWCEKSWIEANLGHMYLAENEGAMLGAICVKPSVSGFFIETLVVGLKHQGAGVGRLLIEYAKKLIRNERTNRLAVCSFAVYGKKRFYENCGFTYVREVCYEDQTGNKHPYHCFLMEL